MRRTPLGAATRQRKRTRWAPACFRALTASTAERQVLGHLVGHQHGDLVHELLEVARRGALVAQNRELVLDQGVPEHGEIGELRVGHGGRSYVARGHDATTCRIFAPYRRKNALALLQPGWDVRSSGHEGTPVSDRLVRLRCWRRLRYVACLTLAAGCGHAVASIRAVPPPPPAPGPSADSLAAADRAREAADRRARQRAADSAAAAADGHRPTAARHAEWKARPPRRRKENGASAVDVAQSRLSPGQVRYTGPDTMVVDSSVQVH